MPFPPNYQRRLTLDNPEAIAATEGVPLQAISANAKKKQYDLSVTLHIVETGTKKEYFNTVVSYTAIPYGSMVAIEDALLNVLGKLANIGEAIAFGTTTPPPVGPT